MAIICKLINATTGGVLNKDSDIQALATTILNEGVIDDATTGNLKVTAGQVASGRCFIEVTRTNTSPEETFLLYVWNQQNEAVTIGSNKKIFIQIPQDNINDNTLNTSPIGSGIAEIVVDVAFPSGNYIPLAEIDGGGAITDLRPFATLKGSLVDGISSSQITGGNWKIPYTNGSGETIELALGAVGEVLQSNGETSAPTFENVSTIGGITGEIKIWTTGTPPTNWLICNGASLLRAGTYASLFAIIGTTYGSVDGTHFNLPNLKGKVVVGYDSTQTEFDALGETGGAKTVTLDATMIPSHTHTFPLLGGTGGAGNNVYGGGAGGGVAGTGTPESIGGGLAHNNLQPYIVLNYIIKI
ncbi:MAG: tail fiber protein [Candidatus Gracilibacteria bacterium]|nr:tail fiber protein [Candidatus Gracilibacteria bacterium]